MPIQAADPSDTKISNDSDTTVQAAAAVTTGVAGSGQTGVAGISVAQYEQDVRDKAKRSSPTPTTTPQNMAEVIQQQLAKQESSDASSPVTVPAKYSGEVPTDRIVTPEGGSAPVKSLENIIQVETTVKTTSGEEVTIVAPLSKFNQEVKDQILTPELIRDYNAAQIQEANKKDPVLLDQTYDPYSHGTTREIPISERPGVQEAIYKIYDETGKKVNIPKTPEQIYQEEQYNKAITGMGMGNVNTFVETYVKDPVGRFDPVYPIIRPDLVRIAQPGLNFTTSGERIDQWNTYEGSDATFDRAISSAFAPIDLALGAGSVFGAGKVAGIVSGLLKPAIVKLVTTNAGRMTAGTVVTSLVGMSALAPSGTEQAYNIPIIKQFTDAGETVRNFGKMAGATNTPTGYIINFGAGILGEDILKAPMGIAATGLGLASLATSPPANILDTLRSNTQKSMEAIGTDLLTDPVGASGAMFGGVLLGTKTLKIFGKGVDKVNTNIVRGAQSSLHAELATQAGLPGSSAKTSYYAAGDMVNQIKKLNIDPVEAGTLKIDTATMMEGINPTIIERAMANADSQMYGTSSHAIYNMGNYRKTSDIDFSVPAEKFDTLANDLLNAIPESREPHLASGEGIRGISAITPSGETRAHIFDIHAVDPNTPAGKLHTPYEDLNKINIFETDQTTYPRTPTTIQEYSDISIPFAEGSVLVEPAYSAAGRKFAAVFQPRLGEVSASLSAKTYVTPKGVRYTTNIDLGSYAKGMVRDSAKGEQYRILEPKSVSYKTARVIGTIGNIPAKVAIMKKSGFWGKGVSETSKRINLIPELADAHRAKDALDILGIGYETTTHLVSENTLNPFKRILVPRKISRDLDKLTSDPYFSAIARSGAQSKLHDLSPEFADYLYKKGILDKTALDRIQKAKTDTSSPTEKTAFTDGKIDTSSINTYYVPPKTAKKPAAVISGSVIPPVNERATPYADASTEKNYGRHSIKRKELQSSSEYNAANKKPQSYKPAASPYTPPSTPSSSGKSPTYQPSAYQTFNSPYSSQTIAKTTPKSTLPNQPILKSYTAPSYKLPAVTQPKRKKDDLDDDLFKRYKPLRRETIHHLSIIDPAEAINAGSFTGSRKRPERIINTKNLIYEISSTSRTKRSRRT